MVNEFQLSVDYTDNTVNQSIKKEIKMKLNPDVAGKIAN